ncbi:MAG: phospholipase D-like domain-containing protein, partial [Verrucomicrobiota bacterium]
MTWTAFIVYLITLAAIPHVLLSKKRPAATLAWIWSILLFPIVGALAYLLLGADRIKRRRLRRVAKAKFARHGESPGAAAKMSSQSPSAAALIRALANINGIPPSTATSLRLLIDASTFYPALKQRIEQARHHVHVEFFIWRNDNHGQAFLDLLVAAARRGIQVRLLLDQIGCFGTKRKFFDPLVEAGGEFTWFYSLPFGRHSRFTNLRNHRKLQIIDGEFAFVGGMNIGREYAGEDPAFGAWRDTQIEVQGNVVTFLQ